MGWDQVTKAYYSEMPVMEIDKQIDALLQNYQRSQQGPTSRRSPSVDFLPGEEPG